MSEYCILHVKLTILFFYFIFIFFRTRVLVLNTFDLAETSVTIDNVLDLIGTLNTTYPQEFGEIADKLETCDLDKELQNVRSSLWQES